MGMKFTSMFIVTIFVLAGSVLAINAESVEETNATTPVFIPASDLKWSDLDPAGAPGVKVVDPMGRPSKRSVRCFVQTSGGI